MIEIGLDKNILAMMSLPIVLVELVLPFIIDKYVLHHGPLSIQLKVYLFRLFYCFVSFSLFYIATHIKITAIDVHSSYPFPSWYYAIVLSSFILYRVKYF